MDKYKYKCKYCKGKGHINFPDQDIECWNCVNDDEAKKKCWESNKTGWKKKQISEGCSFCNGDGYVARKQ